MSSLTNFSNLLASVSQPTPQEPAAVNLSASLSKYATSILPASVYVPPPPVKAPTETPATSPPPGARRGPELFPQPGKTPPSAPSNGELDAKASAAGTVDAAPHPPSSDYEMTEDVIAMLESGAAAPLGTMPWAPPESFPVAQTVAQNASGAIPWAKIGLGVGMVVVAGLVVRRLVR